MAAAAQNSSMAAAAAAAAAAAGFGQQSGHGGHHPHQQQQQSHVNHHAALSLSFGSFAAGGLLARQLPPGLQPAAYESLLGLSAVRNAQHQAAAAAAASAGVPSVSAADGLAAAAGSVLCTVPAGHHGPAHHPPSFLAGLNPSAAAAAAAAGMAPGAPNPLVGTWQPPFAAAAFHRSPFAAQFLKDRLIPGLHSLCTRYWPVCVFSIYFFIFYEAGKIPL